MVVVLAIRVPIAPRKVLEGVYMTSYMVIIPFWFISGTSFQDTLIAVEDTVTACTLFGGASGTGKQE